MGQGHREGSSPGESLFYFSLPRCKSVSFGRHCATRWEGQGLGLCGAEEGLLCNMEGRGVWLMQEGRQQAEKGHGSSRHPSFC